MRRVLVLAFVLLMVPQFALADGSPEEPLGWALSGGGFDDDILAGHIVLDDNNVVSAGSFTTSAIFEEESVESTGMLGDADMFIAISNSSGNWSSVQGYGSDGADGIDAIALHTSGDIIVVGHFCLGTAGNPCGITFNQNFVLNKSDDNGEGDAFVGRFSLTGNVITPIWIRAISNNNDLTGFDVEVGPNGGISVGVNHKGFLEIEEYILTGAEGNSIAILHYDENGNLMWVNGISSQDGIESFGGMCYSQSGYLHITGTFIGSVMFIEREFSQGEADIFAAQIDGDGNFTWTSFAGGTGEDWANDCAIDSNGIMHIVGQIEDTATFGFTNVTSNGWRDMFHATLTTNGDWDSVMNAGGGGWENLESLVIDMKDNLIVTGTYTSTFTLGVDELTDRDSNGDKRDVFVAQLDNNNQWVWAISAGGAGDDVAVSVQFGENESPIIGMLIQNTAQMSNFSLSSSGANDVALWNYARDHDSDGLPDGSDNCPRTANPDQIDTDGDLYGDACDDDDDGDSIGDYWDDCNPGETGWNSAPNTDHDGDGCRDVSEDFDDDEDGIMDYYDECPEGPVGWISTIENDENQDGCEDQDTDGDGYVDQLDKCPGISDDQADLDGDGIGDACETDTDGDGISDEFDNCIRDSFVWNSSHEEDHDQDGCRDLDRDPDDDGDGVLDLSDSCPTGEINWNATFDHDNDGCHDDFEDTDDDSDTFADSDDSCPRGYVGQAGVGMDLDQDGCIDSMEDDDDDNDGVEDSLDQCRYTPAGMEVDSTGCSGVQLDDDGDGVHNLNDLCPASSPGEMVSSTGCAVETQDQGKGASDEESSSSLIWILFSIAIILVIVALVVTFKPQQPLPPKAVPKVESSESVVDNGGGQGDSGTASSDIDDSSLDIDTTQSEVATDESGGSAEDSALVE